MNESFTGDTTRTSGSGTPLLKVTNTLINKLITQSELEIIENKLHTHYGNKRK